MTPAEKAKQILDLAEKVKAWPLRLKILATRKADPLDEAQFCERYAIEKTVFNRIKNEKRHPQKEIVEAAETAFAKEGV